MKVRVCCLLGLRLLTSLSPLPLPLLPHPPPTQIPVLPGPPDGLCRLPGLRFLALNAMGLAAWPLPPAANALPNLQELQVRECVGHVS